MRKNKNKKKRNISPGKFFTGYFIIITVILIWNILHCTKISWNTAYAFPAQGNSIALQTDEALELKDDAPLTVRAADQQDASENSAKAFGKNPCLRGVALLGYENVRSLLFSDETVTAEVVKAGTEEVLGSGTLALKNQTIYPNDETSIYITLSEPVTQILPEEVEIRFRTSGLTRNGIFLSGAAADEEGSIPLARLYFEKKKWSPWMSLLYYVLEVLAGLGCLLLSGEHLFPLFRKRRSARNNRKDLLQEDVLFTEDSEDGKDAGKPSFGRMAEKAVLPALVLFFCACLMLYTYAHVIKKTAAARDADLLTGGSSAEETITLEPGTRLRQSFTAGKDSLSGIGIRLAEEDGGQIESVKDLDCADSFLEWQLFDESGSEMLASGKGQIKDLKAVSTVLSKDIKDEKTLETAGQSFVLELDQTVKEAEGKRFVLEIAVSGQEGTQEKVHLPATGDTNGRTELSGSASKTLPLEICLMGTYKCNGFIKGMYLRVCAALLLMLAGLYYAARRFSRPGTGRRKQTAAMYLVSALCMGMVFSFLTPAYTISDERTHIDSVYILSNRLLEIRDVPGPSRLLKRACDIDSSIANTMPVTAERYRTVEEGLFRAAPKSAAAGSAGSDQRMDQNMDEKGEGSVSDAGIASGRELTPAYTRSALDNVPLLCYLPAAIGFSAARILGRNMITMVMTARWLNLLVCVLIICLAIGRMPYAGAAMAVIALFPKTLQQMSSCSYDGMVIAGTFLFIALSLTAAFDEDVCILDLLGLILSGLFVAACKGGAYLPVLGLALMIPAARSEKNAKMQKIWRMIGWASVVGAALLFMGKYVVRLLSMFGRESGKATIAAGTKTLYTVSDFVHSPFKLVKIYLSTIALRGDGLLGELVGKNLCQRWYFVYAFLLLALLGLLRRYSGGRDGSGTGVQQDLTADRNHICLPGRLWILFLTAGSVSLVFLSMLLAFTMKGTNYVDGLQGRYFLPIAPLPFLAAENGLVHRNGIGDTALIYAADVLLAVTFCEIFLTYLTSM